MAARQHDRAYAAATYAVAGLLGLGAMCLNIPAATLLGTGGVWTNPAGDAAMGLTGHLAFQAPGWHWPLLRAPDLAWPVGRSIAMSDSNPLMSLAAKILAGVAGHPINLLGAWLGLCWVLQPVASVFVLRSMFAHPRCNTDWSATLAASCFGLLFPAWLMRHHINLSGHFLLLGALGLSLRMAGGPRPPRWRAACLLLALSVLVHPYVFVFSALVLSAPLCRAALYQRERLWRMLGGYAAACGLPVALLWVLSGSLGASAPGFGYFSMNLLSPVWPQASGLFGPGLPVVDATVGQYEGFNYLGAGSVLLSASAAWLIYRRPIRDRARRQVAFALALPLTALTLIALTHRVYAGHVLVIALPDQPWRQVLAAIQASGRAFWMVGYAITIGAVAILAVRLRPTVLRPVLVMAIVLQAIDTAPMVARAQDYLAGLHQAPPPFAMPDGATLLRVVPACDHVNAPADLLRLDAVRHRMRLADMRMARQAPGFDCETALSDGLEAPLVAGEIRFFLPSAEASFRADAFGPEVTCTGLNAGILCSHLAWDQPGTRLAIGPAVPALTDATGPANAQLPPTAFSFGWRRSGGVFWSEGPRATLLFRRAAGLTGPVSLVLDIDTLASGSGARRDFLVRGNEAEPVVLSLADQQRTDVTIRLGPPRPGLPDRVVFDMRRPVDPAHRAIAAPVHRAALRVYGIRLSPRQE